VVLEGEGRRGGGIAYRDSARVHPCSLFLDFLSRKVPVGNTPSPTSTVSEYNYQKPLAHDYARSRGGVVPYFRTLSDRDVAPERTWRYSQRVLK